MGNDIQKCVECFQATPTPILRENSFHHVTSHKGLETFDDPLMKAPILNDFSVIKVFVSIYPRSRLQLIGKGTLNKVYLVQHNAQQKEYILKKIAKKEILKTKQETNILRKAFLYRLHRLVEKKVLSQANHPFIIPLLASFQDAKYIYFLTPFCQGGELTTLVRGESGLQEKAVQFYAAEILLALEFLNDRMGIVYRDMKPQNILLDEEGHIKLIDFGFAKGTLFLTIISITLQRINLQTASVVLRNTLHQKSSSVLNSLMVLRALGLPHDQAVDLWGFGCVLYFLFTGRPPFLDPDEDRMSKLIVSAAVEYPLGVMSDSAIDLITRLLTKDPNERKAGNSWAAIRQHAFFQGIEWDALLAKRVQPPLIPVISPQHKSTAVRRKSKNPDQTLSNLQSDVPQEDEGEVNFPDFDYIAPMAPFKESGSKQ